MDLGYGLSFEEYDKNNIRHISLVRTLDNDPKVQEVFNSLESYIHNIIDNEDKNITDKVYVVTGYDENIGLIMSKMYGNKLHISYALSPKFRGEAFSVYMLDTYSDYLFRTYPKLDKVYVQINPQNKASKVVAAKVGFVKENIINYSLENYYKK